MILKFRHRSGAAFPVIACCLAGILLCLPVAGRAQRHGAFWTGESGGYQITWTERDLVARKGATTVFSAREFAKAGLAHYVEAGREPSSGKMPACIYERRFRLIAVVGTVMSFSDRYYASCPKEAHPGGETRFTTIDLAAGGTLAYKGRDAFGIIESEDRGKALLLTDFVSPQAVYEKLRSAPLVVRLLGQEANSPKPRNLAELMEQLSGKLGEGEDCVSVPKDILSRFAIRRADPGGSIISLGFPGAGPCRDELTTVDLQFSSGALLKPIAGGGMPVSFLAGTADWQEGTKETVVALRTNPPRR